ncbi:MAG: hypothetical protein ABI297_04225 [Ginsengibacter sp.]
MEFKKVKKSNLYLLISVIGIGLIISGIVLLIDALKVGDRSQITIKIVVLFLWIFFTISNLYIYKKERQKEKN